MTQFMKVENPKVGLFYENDIPYLTLELGTKIKGNKANVKIHKIKLDKIDITTETETQRWDNPVVPPMIWSTSRKITFNLEPINKEGEILTITVDQNKKKMTKDEIEKELGYGIEIVG